MHAGLNAGGWEKAPFTQDFVDIEGPVRPTPAYRTRVKMMWDDRNLYVAAELQDPDVWATLLTHDQIIFHDNDFEVFIDPDSDCREYYEIEVNALRGRPTVARLRELDEHDAARIDGSSACPRRAECHRVGSPVRGQSRRRVGIGGARR